MAHSRLPYSPEDSSDAFSLQDRVQIALAIADPTILKSLLVDCIPPIAHSHEIGTIHASVGVPIEPRQTIDGLIQFESIDCALIDAAVEPEMAQFTSRTGPGREQLDMLRCEAETRTLGQSVTLSQAIAMLSHSGFSSRQVDEILQLPSEAWHKSWWYALDSAHCLSVPFLRLIRTRRYADGTLTLQYKDFYSQDKPPSFKSHEEKVLVEIHDGLHRFGKTLEKINYARQQLGLSKALLICDRLSDLESRGFISQGISLYARSELFLPTPASCAICVTQDCPLQGARNSPVLLCRQFCVEASPERE